MKWKIFLTQSLLLIFMQDLISQQIIINEVMTNNATIAEDEDGDDSDWIELFNTTNDFISLTGYGLSDDVDDPFKWVFADYTMSPGEYLLVWASDKNLQAGSLLPEEIPGLMAWFNAGDIDVSDTNQIWINGDECFVKKWLSHNGQNLAQQGTQSKRPLYTINAIGQNPAIRFDGSSDMLISDVLPPQGNASRTIIVMLANANMQTGNQGTNNHILHYGGYTGAYGLSCKRWSSGGLIGNSYWNNTFYGIAVMDENPRFVSEVFNGLSDSYFVNGQFSGTNFITLNTASNFTMRIASRIGDGNDWFAGDIAEIIIYDTSLSREQRRRVENYLALKYQLPVQTFHTNFKLALEGEKIILTRPNGDLESEIEVPLLSVDYSFGKSADGYAYFISPTPGSENNTTSYSKILNPPVFSVDAGFFTDTVFLNLTSDEPGAIVLYTLDGSEPDIDHLSGFDFPVKYDYSICNSGELSSRQSNTFIYNSSLTLGTNYNVPNDRSQITASYLYWNPPSINTAKANVVRAAAWKEGTIQSKTVTKTYFVDTAAFVKYSLPVVSVVTSDYNLFNYDTGMYVPGLHYDMTCANPVPEPNYRQNGWERAFHFELFDNQGNIQYEKDAGGAIHGSFSSHWPRKSIAFEARRKYGDEAIFSYALFPGLKQNPLVGFDEIDEFNTFIIRNSGNNWKKNLFHDAMVHRLVNHLVCDPQASRAVVHFLNGEYWGIMNLREKHTDYYFAEHYNMDPGDVIIANGRTQTITTGYAYEYQHYSNIEFFVNNNSLTDPVNYNYVNTQMDIENYATHFLIEIYVNNTDFLGNNRKYWRKRTQQYYPNAPYGHDGRWRWLLYDVDQSFADPEFDRLTSTTTGTGSPTLFLRKLLENNDFKNYFINSFCDQMNSTFLPGRITQIVDSMRMEMDHDVPEHIQRWNNLTPDQNCSEIISFSQQRPYFMRQHLRDRFELTDTCIITLNTNKNQGSITINSLKISTNTVGLQNPEEPYPWSGVYFLNVPIRLVATPKQGFVFSHWSTNEENDTIFINVADNFSITAFFTASQTTNDSLIINEINYNSSPDFDPDDWIEFFNPQNYPLNISNWYFRDEDDEHTFVFPENTIIGANDYLVLCSNIIAFSSLFPQVANYLGDMDFGFSGNGELLRLYNNNDVLIDTVNYDDAAPWPTEPDGNGPTLELIRPELDNALAQSWMASSGNGTPGIMNSNLAIIEKPVNSFADFVKVVPNPANGEFRLLFSNCDFDKGLLEVFRIDGTLLKTIQLINKESSIDISNISRGVYILKITMGDVVINRRLVID